MAGDNGIILKTQDDGGNNNNNEEPPNDDTNNNENNNANAWSRVLNQMAVPLTAADYVPTFWRQGTRPDGRLWGQVRPTTVQASPLQNSDIAGSALLALGRTRVVATVTLAVGQQATTAGSTVNAGGDVTVTLSPPCGPSEAALQQQWMPVQSYVQRVLDETLDFTQLALQPQDDDGAQPSSNSNSRRWAWRLQLTLQVLQDDGNLWDAALLAGVAALHHTQLPTGAALQWDDDNDKGRVWLDPEASRTGLTLPVVPLPLTLGRWVDDSDDDKEASCWIADPDRLEDESGHLDSALTVIVNGADSADSKKQQQSPEILSLEYSATAPQHHLSMPGDLLLAIHMATARAREVRALLSHKKDNDDVEEEEEA